MSVFGLFSEQWLARTALAGGAVLLAGVLWMLATRQPARRQWFGETALLCALLVAALCALPAWLPIAIPLCQAPASGTEITTDPITARVAPPVSDDFLPPTEEPL